MSFLSVDGTFFVQLINFAIFFGILSFVFLRPVGRAIVARRAYINSVTADYDRYQSQASELRAQAEQIRAAARREAEQQLAKARAESSNEAARLSSEFSERASGISASAQEQVNSELQKARAQQAGAIRSLSDLIVQRALPELGA